MKVLRPVPTFEDIIRLPDPVIKFPFRVPEVSRPDPNIWDEHSDAVRARSVKLLNHVVHDAETRAAAHDSGIPVDVLRSTMSTAMSLSHSASLVAAAAQATAESNRDLGAAPSGEAPPPAAPAQGPSTATFDPSERQALVGEIGSMFRNIAAHGGRQRTAAEDEELRRLGMAMEQAEKRAQGIAAVTRESIAQQDQHHEMMRSVLGSLGRRMDDTTTELSRLGTHHRELAERHELSQGEFHRLLGAYREQLADVVRSQRAGADFSEEMMRTLRDEGRQGRAAILEQMAGQMSDLSRRHSDGMDFTEGLLTTLRNEGNTQRAALLAGISQTNQSLQSRLARQRSRAGPTPSGMEAEAGLAPPMPTMVSVPMTPRSDTPEERPFETPPGPKIRKAEATPETGAQPSTRMKFGSPFAAFVTAKSEAASSSSAVPPLPKGFATPPRTVTPSFIVHDESLRVLGSDPHAAARHLAEEVGTSEARGTSVHSEPSSGADGGDVPFRPVSGLGKTTARARAKSKARPKRR